MTPVYVTLLVWSVLGLLALPIYDCHRSLSRNTPTRKQWAFIWILCGPIVMIVASGVSIHRFLGD